METPEKHLISLQKEIDEEYDIYVKEEFNLRLQHHKTIIPILQRRDNIIAKIENFWPMAIIHYDLMMDMLPLICDKIEVDFISKLKVWYEENKICVKIVIAPNKFLKSKEIIKKMNVFDKTVEETKLEYKQNINSKLLEFFENGKFDKEMFDIFYELYVNGIFYYCLQYD
ncbi:Nucleosome assembly protein [Spraguea lophii 42_110]|uniref:Nucleosome assembly protein n=1 Tax=Spraguea lophii (strain 42_110) TaxID=1358809 RepID=S7XI49_SPRLO|nr:Nucleosome assembly protein [Spraguea lophii 42_110]